MKVAVKLLMVVAAVLPLTAATITLGNHPQQPGECNILFTNGVTGNPVTGTLNSANGCTAGQIVSFSSLTEQTLAESASGQARIETTTGGALTSMAVTVPGLTYGDLICNLAVIGGLRATGTATIDVLSPTSTLLSSLTFDLGQGQNFVTWSLELVSRSGPPTYRRRAAALRASSSRESQVHLQLPVAAVAGVAEKYRRLPLKVCSAPVLPVLRWRASSSREFRKSVRKQGRVV